MNIIFRVIGGLILFFVFAFLALLSSGEYMSPRKMRHRPFLYKYCVSIIYLVFLIGLFLNGGVAILNFRNGQWLLAIWALFSIFTLPKAALGLILLASRGSITSLDMPPKILKIFPGTLQRYDFSFLYNNSILKGVLRELILLGVSLFPFVVFLLKT